ncbi:MAG TPA: TlpA disulfide reductase family protein [Acidimicrobiales bacterium]|nr:TlpA disulfide reductase family protein [Acidimicrobiales bacterium]
MKLAHMKLARWTACGVGLGALVLVAVLATRPPATQTTSSPLIGKPAPSVAGRNLSGGISSLASLRGHWVLLNFFASWCPPCRTESPDLVKFVYSRPDGQRVAVLGVVYGDTEGNAAAFERQVGATWPSVVDANEQIAINYGVDDPPQSFLIAPDGRVVDRILGGVTVGALDRLVENGVAAHA